MPQSAISPPKIDPTPIFELFRGSYGSQLLTAAIAHFDIFGQLSGKAATFDTLRESLGLQSRPAHVLFTALRAMGLLEMTDDGLQLTAMAAEHLVPDGPFDVGNYVGLAAQDPGVLSMVDLLRSNKPLQFDDGGAAYIYRDGMKSAMEATESARHFTLALSGRAKNVAPALAQALKLNDARTLVDVGGETGIYSYALLQQNPQLKAIIVDRPEVLRVAEELGQQYGVLDRTELRAGDMFTGDLPADADVVLLSNILHDWDVPECKQLVQRCSSVLSPGGQLVIHDVFLNDQHDGPLPIALYSAALFTLTEGRAYSQLEYKTWMQEAGLTTSDKIDTLVHCGILAGTKP